MGLLSISFAIKDLLFYFIKPLKLLIIIVFKQFIVHKATKGDVMKYYKSLDLCFKCQLVWGSVLFQSLLFNLALFIIVKNSSFQINDWKVTNFVFIIIITMLPIFQKTSHFCKATSPTIFRWFHPTNLQKIDIIS